MVLRQWISWRVIYLSYQGLLLPQSQSAIQAPLKFRFLRILLRWTCLPQHFLPVVLATLLRGETIKSDFNSLVLTITDTRLSFHCLRSRLSRASFCSRFSSFSFGYSFTYALFKMESPFPMHIRRISEKWLLLFSILLIPSKADSIGLSDCFLAQRCRYISCRILAHLRVSFIGQSLIVLSSTTELLRISFPVKREVYLLLYSVESAAFGSMLL